MARREPGKPTRPVALWLVVALVVASVAICGLGLFQLFGPLAWRNVVQGWVSVFIGLVCLSGGINELVQRRGDESDPSA